MKEGSPPSRLSDSTEPTLQPSGSRKARPSFDPLLRFLSQSSLMNRSQPSPNYGPNFLLPAREWASLWLQMSKTRFLVRLKRKVLPERSAICPPALSNGAFEYPPNTSWCSLLARTSTGATPSQYLWKSRLEKLCSEALKTSSISLQLTPLRLSSERSRPRPSSCTRAEGSSLATGKLKVLKAYSRFRVLNQAVLFNASTLLLISDSSFAKQP